MPVYEKRLLNLQYNFHTHTYRCSHATGTEREYIERAISGGIKNMGFSDHCPFRFPDGYESPFRVPTASAVEYMSTIGTLREEYKDKIKINIGFEMEYYPQYYDEMLSKARSYGAEYLILGQHFLYNEYPNGKTAFEDTDSIDDLKYYVDCVVSAIKSGCYTYVAHPDALKFVGDKSAYIQEMRKICVASREYNIPVEINFLGIRGHRHYPNEAFWKIAAEEKSPVVFGNDAHDVVSAYDPESLVKAKELVQRLNLNYIGMPKLLHL